MGMLAGVTDCRRSPKWDCRGRLVPGFKSRLSSHTREDPVAWLGPCGFGVLPFCYVAWEAEETLLGRKGVKGLLLVGHEKVPHGFGLTGDCGGNTADGARSLNHGLVLVFLI